MLARKTPLKKEAHVHFLGKLIYIQGDIWHREVITYKKGVYSEKCWEVQGQPFRKDSKIAQIGSVFLLISHKFKYTDNQSSEFYSQHTFKKT